MRSIQGHYKLIIFLYFYIYERKGQRLYQKLLKVPLSF